MKLTTFVASALLFVALFSAPTQAQAYKSYRLHQHHIIVHKKHHLVHKRHHVIRPAVQTVAGDISGHGVRFVRGRLICAINVSNWLRAHGFHSPASRSSKAFLKFAKVAAANARYGDIHFNYRKGGGHVMIALGNGRCLNPSASRQSWVNRACPAGGLFVRT